MPVELPGSRSGKRGGGVVGGGGGGGVGGWAGGGKREEGCVASVPLVIEGERKSWGETSSLSYEGEEKGGGIASGCLS